MGGGKGDSGAYERRQAEIEFKKQEARDRLNLLFGMETPGALKVGSDVDYRYPDGTRYDPQRTPMTLADKLSEQMNRPKYDAAVSANAANSEQIQAQNAETLKANRSARDQLYQTVRDNAFQAGTHKLDEDRTNAARKLKFELFARGLAGGSEDIDQNAQLGRTYQTGLLDLGAKADAAKAQFRGDDENTRLQLLQSIDAGMDQGSALSAATQRMQIAADRAAADAQGTAVGNLFDNANLLYTQGQAAKGKQDAVDWWNQYGPSRKGGQANPTGTTTKLPGE